MSRWVGGRLDRSAWRHEAISDGDKVCLIFVFFSKGICRVTDSRNMHDVNSFVQDNLSDSILTYL